MQVRRFAVWPSARLQHAHDLPEHTMRAVAQKYKLRVEDWLTMPVKVAITTGDVHAGSRIGRLSQAFGA
jgi:hypothetical protein